MDKTYTFKDNELRLTDTLLEIDFKEVPYEMVEKVAFKPASFGNKGWLSLKPEEGAETRFYFKLGINKQIAALALHICKKSGAPLDLVKKSASKLPWLLCPIALAVAACVVFFVFFHEGNGSGADVPIEAFADNFFEGEPFDGDSHTIFDGEGNAVGGVVGPGDGDAIRREQTRDFEGGIDFLADDFLENEGATREQTRDFADRPDEPTIPEYVTDFSELITDTLREANISLNFELRPAGTGTYVAALNDSGNITAVFNNGDISSLSYLSERAGIAEYAVIGALVQALTGTAPEEAVLFAIALADSGEAALGGFAFELFFPAEGAIAFRAEAD